MSGKASASMESLGEAVAELERENERLRQAVRELTRGRARRDYKDTVFKYIFGNPDKREWTLSLYNAVSGRSLEDPWAIAYATIDDVIYVGMRNDVSFIVSSELTLWEHQSSFNPNMPLRFLLYAARVYDGIAAASGYRVYSSELLRVPAPSCVCFYNGEKDQPDRQVLTLSQAYGGEGDIEVSVTMYNVNHGRNAGLMAACRPLREYAWLVEAVRRHLAEQRELGQAPDVGAAADAAIGEMPRDFEIRDFIVKNRAEVRGMFLTEYDQAQIVEDADERVRAAELERDAAKRERDEALRSQARAAALLLREGRSASEVAGILGVDEDAVRGYAREAGLEA